MGWLRLRLRDYFSLRTAKAYLPRRNEDNVRIQIGPMEPSLPTPGKWPSVSCGTSRSRYLRTMSKVDNLVMDREPMSLAVSTEVPISLVYLPS